MADRISNRNSRTLIDQHGQWCALCAEYFKLAEEIHRHHVLPQAWVKARFPGLDFACVVPAHARCHLPDMQDKAEAMKSYLKDLLAGDTRPEDRDERARWFHDHGYYWYGVLINLDTIQRLRGLLSADEIWRRRAFLLSSAAGIRGASNIREFIVNEPMSSRPLPMLNLANLQLARGHLKAGRAALKDAQDILEAIPPGPAKEVAKKQLEALLIVDNHSLNTFQEMDQRRSKVLGMQLSASVAVAGLSESCP